MSKAIIACLNRSYQFHRLARIVVFEQKIEDKLCLNLPNLGLKKSLKGLKICELLAAGNLNYK